MTLTVAGINFDHKHHMWSLLRDVDAHPDTGISALCDVDSGNPDRGVNEIVDRLGLDSVRCYSEYDTCLEFESPDIVLLCPAAAEHGEWVERVAPFDRHIVLECRRFDVDGSNNFD